MMKAMKQAGTMVIMMVSLMHIMILMMPAILIAGMLQEVTSEVMLKATMMGLVMAILTLTVQKKAKDGKGIYW